jgi:hypothetical protein
VKTIDVPQNTLHFITSGYIMNVADRRPYDQLPISGSS